jgi:hypothetical protein
MEVKTRYPNVFLYISFVLMHHQYVVTSIPDAIVIIAQSLYEVDVEKAQRCINARISCAAPFFVLN